MKVVYEFDPYEDREELRMIQKASDYCCALHDIDQKCRSEMKYSQEEIPDKWYEFLEEIRELCRVADEV